MKNRSFIFAALILALGSFLVACGTSAPRVASASATETQSHARPVDASEGVPVAMGVQSAAHVQVALLSAEQMLDGEGLQASEAAIVVCGPGISALQKGSDLAAAIKHAHARGVRVVACNISLTRMNVSADTLLEEVEVVENAFTELLRLQTLGYYSIVM